MAPPPASEPPASGPSTTAPEFEAQLRQVETALQAVRDRYAEVTAAQSDQQALRVQQSRVQQALRQHRTAALQQELKQIKARLSELELTLESQLFSWRTVSEPFWMAVRFGGVGLLLGWVLRSL
ncbi:MAG: hypothetical protein AAF289_14105 [Cyanobacteria bacterium P01_A01_bin.135]